LQRTTRTLRQDIDGLQHDPAKIEQLAREQLGYVRKGETVYQLIPSPSRERSRP
jgi:cell division protein FtsB